MSVPRRRLPDLLAASLVFGSLVSPTSAQLLGPEFQVNSYTPSQQGEPAVAADGAGGFVVVWSSWDQDGSGLGVFGQRFDSSGLPVGGEFQVNEATTGHQLSPAVAADGAGSFVVSWTSDGQDGSAFGVFARRFDPAGAPLGHEFQVNSYTPFDQRDSALAAVFGDEFVVAWASESQDGEGFGVFGRRGTFALFRDGFETADACAWSATVGGGCP